MVKGVVCVQRSCIGWVVEGVGRAMGAQSELGAVLVLVKCSVVGCVLLCSVGVEEVCVERRKGALLCDEGKEENVILVG